MAKRSPKRMLIILSILAAISCICFMTLNVLEWRTALEIRIPKLIALILVGYAVAVSTILFQTITRNRILTPSIIGFDQLYILIQTLIVFLFGMASVSLFGSKSMFLIETLIMVVAAVSLFQWLFSGTVKSLHLVLLVGIIFGVLFRSLSALMQNMIDPNDFAYLQMQIFATFNSFDNELLGLSVLLIIGFSIPLWRMRFKFDVLALGRENAINLGLNYQRFIMVIATIIAIFVAISTALAGPVPFFGLLVANLAWSLAGTARHTVVLPLAALIAIICLVGGQVVLEHGFNANALLSIIIEFAGGIVFIMLLLKGKLR